MNEISTTQAPEQYALLAGRHFSNGMRLHVDYGRRAAYFHRKGSAERLPVALWETALLIVRDFGQMYAPKIDMVGITEEAPVPVAAPDAAMVAPAVATKAPAAVAIAPVAEPPGEPPPLPADPIDMEAGWYTLTNLAEITGAGRKTLSGWRTRGTVTARKTWTGPSYVVELLLDEALVKRLGGIGIRVRLLPAAEPEQEDGPGVREIPESVHESVESEPGVHESPEIVRNSPDTAQAPEYSGDGSAALAALTHAPDVLPWDTLEDALDDDEETAALEELRKAQARVAECRDRVLSFASMHRERADELLQAAKG